MELLVYSWWLKLSSPWVLGSIPVWPDLIICLVDGGFGKSRLLHADKAIQPAMSLQNRHRSRWPDTPSASDSSHTPSLLCSSCLDRTATELRNTGFRFHHEISASLLYSKEVCSQAEEGPKLKRSKTIRCDLDVRDEEGPNAAPCPTPHHCRLLCLPQPSSHRLSRTRHLRLEIYSAEGCWTGWRRSLAATASYSMGTGPGVTNWGVGVKKLLLKRFRVVEVDEYKTSVTCNICLERLSSYKKRDGKTSLCCKNCGLESKHL
jgi:hypothetical protein